MKSPMHAEKIPVKILASTLCVQIVQIWHPKGKKPIILENNICCLNSKVQRADHNNLVEHRFSRSQAFSVVLHHI